MFNVSLSHRRSRLCSGHTRRDFLRVGALAPFGLSLGHLLAAEAEEPRRARAKSVILVFLGGGLSHHDTFDLKPDAPEEIRGKYSGIPSNVPGLHVGELLPKMAQTMDKVALVRSASHENDHHETATNWVLSGRFGSPFGDYPAMGAVVAHETGFSGLLPPYVAIPRNPSFTWELGKSAFLGGRCESFKTGNPNADGFAVRDLAPPNVTPESVARRESLLKAVDRLASRVEGSDQIETYDEFHRKAAEMALAPEARSAFDLDAESEALRDAYGRTEFGQSCLLARRLVESGVRFATVNFAGWDHHSEIWKGLEDKVPQFDQGFSALIGDLDERGLLDDTLVLAMGEFGRTPKVNDQNGRDHWGRAGSLIFAGAGVHRGAVLGATDRIGAYVTDRPVRPADVVFTVLDSLGIDPRKELRTADGRPLAILDEGSAITELFS